MKKVEPIYFKKLAIDLLKETYNENPKKIVVGWVSRSALKEELGKISYVQICENKIESQKDFDRWQTRIQINPLKIIKYYDVENDCFRPIEFVISEIEKSELSISLCVKVIKRLKYREYIVKLLDKYFLIKSNFNFGIERDVRNTHEWFTIYDPELDGVGGIKEDIEIYELDYEDVIAISV